MKKIATKLCMALVFIVMLISTATGATEDKLTASDGADDDYFGYSVSVSGDTAVIGTPYDDDNGIESGSAYVFTRTGTTWNQQAKLTASDGAEGDGFGYSVSVSGDTAVIGTPSDEYFLGSAYVFTRTDTTWSQQAKLTASDGAVGGFLGHSVSVSGDTAVIGTPSDEYFLGSAYVFTRTDTTWSQQAKLTASDGAEDDGFGHSVSVSGDTAVIGTPSDDDNGVESGSAYVFTRTDTTWSQQAKLTASDGAEDDRFGYSVSVSGDTAVIGTPNGYGSGPESGSAYVFKRSGTTWTQQAKLTASDGAQYDCFGTSVSVDGDTAVIGAYGDDDNGDLSGSAYVFSLREPMPVPTFPIIAVLGMVFILQRILQRRKG